MSHPRTTAAQGFRERLEQVIARLHLNHAAFARHVGLDRSTLSQLVSPANDRLPRADTLMAIARHCGISVDWLLGLSQRETIGAELVETPFTIETQAHIPFDGRFLGWLAEAGGRKLRTVPVSFPDFLKLPRTMEFEYAVALAAEPQPELAERQALIAAALQEGTDIEACVARQSLESFAAGLGQWAGFGRRDRLDQIEAMMAFADRHYPALRLFLYDVRETYSAPFSVFGQSRVAIYLGPNYLVLNASEHIRLFTRRFDEIIRASAVQPHEINAYLEALAKTLA